MATRTRAEAHPKLFETKVDLPASKRMALVELLNQHLADAFDLKSQVKQAHWNVKGTHFIALHLLFDEIAKELDEFIDTIAERAVALGGVAHGTARMAAAASRLPEYPLDAVDGMEHVEALVDRFGNFANATRAAIESADDLDDKGTSDLFTQILRAADMRLWFLQAHLQERP